MAMDAFSMPDATYSCCGPSSIQHDVMPFFWTSPPYKAMLPMFESSLGAWTMTNDQDFDSIPLVTREEFNKIECNNCGTCCERIHMPSPLVLAQEIGRYTAEKARWPAEAIAALGLEDDMADRERLIDWWSCFEPVNRVEEAGKPLQYQYRCARFARLADGTGMCTDYDARPSTCRSFPNGRPMNAIRECSWNVRIIEEQT